MRYYQFAQKFNPALYLIANKSSFKEEKLFFQKIFDSVQGGVRCVQLRDRDASELSREISDLKALLGPLVSLILNAKDPYHAIGADGVHLEEGVPSLRELRHLREVLGDRAIIGASLKSEEAISNAKELDYVSVKVGASKTTCPYVEDRLWGLDGVKEVRKRLPTSVRVVAVGGLNLTNVAPVLGIADGVAMVGGLMREENPEEVARRILQIWRGQ